MNELGPLLGVVTMLAITVFGTMLVLVTHRHRTELTFQVKLFLTALWLRLALALVLYVGGLVNVIGDEDGSGWIRGLAYSHMWTNAGSTLVDLPYHLLDVFDRQNHGYDFLLGGFFFVTTDSPSRLAAAALNCGFGALTVVFAYRIARTLGSQFVATRVAWWTCLFPSLVLWSASTVKEPVVIFLETVALYGCVRLRENVLSPRHIILCVITVILIFPFRFYAAFIVGLAVLISVLISAFARPGTAFAAGGVLVFLVPALLGTSFWANHIAQMETYADLARIQATRADYATGADRGGSSVATADVRTTTGLVSGLTVGAAHVLLAPFPWQVGASPRALLTLPEMIYWWWLVAYGLGPGLYYCVRKRLPDVTSLLLVIVGLGMVYALTFGNVGLVYRQRAQLLPWLFVFAAIGLEQRMLKKQNREAEGEQDSAPEQLPSGITFPIHPESIHGGA